MTKRSWKVLSWEPRPERVRLVELRCGCGRWADCEVGEVDALIVATTGMGVVFDPPGYRPPANFFPDVIKCRRCGREYSIKE